MIMVHLGHLKKGLWSSPPFPEKWPDPDFVFLFNKYNCSKNIALPFLKNGPDPEACASSVAVLWMQVFLSSFQNVRIAMLSIMRSSKLHNMLVVYSALSALTQFTGIV
jgi:hypothetical protein